MDNDDPECSAEQTAWTEIAEAIRIQLLKMAADMPAMDPDELKTFIDACDNAQWFEHKSRTFDKRLQDERKKLFMD